ncbi:MAG TPA: hypothetical protein VL738_17075 [Dactylosporangium sp.]|nr:hypothetical protein [Dactylosporangium sp.]
MTTPVTAATAIAARGSGQFVRVAAVVHRYTPRRLPVAADRHASCPYARPRPVADACCRRSFVGSHTATS